MSGSRTVEEQQLYEVRLKFIKESIPGDWIFFDRKNHTKESYGWHGYFLECKDVPKRLEEIKKEFPELSQYLIYAEFNKKDYVRIDGEIPLFVLRGVYNKVELSLANRLFSENSSLVGNREQVSPVAQVASFRPDRFDR